jgi:conjugal transfer mating pair stabilization protein TraN
MKLIRVLIFMPVIVFASSNEATALKSQALNAMQSFQPGAVISAFTETPKESRLSNSQSLQQETQQRLAQDETAHFVIKEEHQRAKITPNDKASEITEGARLIDMAEEVVRPGCHKEPVPCEEKRFERTCEETRSMKPVTCTKKLVVHVNAIHHSEVSRVFIKKLATIDLTQCKSQDVYCTNKQLIQLHPQCEHLKVMISLNNQPLRLLKLPTCQDPTVTLAEDNIPPLFKAKIDVTEYRTDDQWEGDACLAVNQDQCMQDISNICLESNQTKLIDGIEVTRRCWGEEQRFQCVSDVVSTCDALMTQGCSNVRAECLSTIGDYCILTSKVFQCVEKTCFPDKEVCPPEGIPCANGSCDQSVLEESDDINEGVSRLGTLAGTAEEVKNNQVTSQSPNIFRGQYQECEKYMFGVRDCCTDDGWLDGMIHCPSELRDLQRAKLEHRAVYLGHYKPRLISTTRYGYCVFPTRLAGIIQIQGRLNQLNVGFGNAKHPDCRGITPEELERIDFKRLDIHELVDDFVSKKTIPDREGISRQNEAHVKALDDKGVPYDK